MGSPDGHKGSADGEAAFQEAANWLRDGGCHGVEGDEGIAGGKVEALLTLDSFRG